MSGSLYHIIDYTYLLGTPAIRILSGTLLYVSGRDCCYIGINIVRIIRICPELYAYSGHAYSELIRRNLFYSIGLTSIGFPSLPKILILRLVLSFHPTSIRLTPHLLRLT